MTTHPKYFLLSSDKLHPYASLRMEIAAEYGICDECKRTVLLKSAHGIAYADFKDKGRDWYDVMHTENMLSLVSEKVVEDLKSDGVTGVEFFPVVIESIESRSLKKKARPNLFWMNIAGMLDIDESCLGVNLERCGACGSFQGVFLPERFVPKADMSSGADFMTTRNIHTRLVICSYRVLELARKHKWSNFLFQPLDIPQKTRPRFYIDHLGKQWPPAWYPKGFEPHVNNTW